MKRPKTNPRRTPLPAAVREAQARDRAITLAWAIFFTVLRDKEGYETEDLQRVWRGVEGLSDSVAKGYVNVRDLMEALDREAGVSLR